MNAHLSAQTNFLLFFPKKNIQNKVSSSLTSKLPRHELKREKEKKKESPHFAPKVDGRRGDKRVIMNVSALVGGVDGGLKIAYPEKNPSESRRLIGTSVVLIALSTIFVVLRLVSRKLSKAGFWVTYYFLSPSNLFIYFLLFFAAKMG